MNPTDIAVYPAVTTFYGAECRPRYGALGFASFGLEWYNTHATTISGLKPGKTKARVIGSLAILVFTVHVYTLCKWSSRIFLKKM